MRVLVGGLGIAVAVLLAYWTMLYLLQRSVIFPGPAVPPAGGPPADAQRAWLDIPDGRVESWLLPATVDVDGGGPLLLFAHGNAESIDLWPEQFGELRRRGVAVMLVEYPGYGRSTGQPSRRSVTAAMVAAWERARDRLGVPAERIVAYGRSLGAGAVCGLADERPLGALILESGFTSAADMARGHFLPSLFLRDPFDNVATLASFAGPVLLIHGRHDEIIPVGHARRLQEAAAAAELHLMDCGHNDCPRPWQRVLEFLSVHGLLPTE